MWRGDCVAVKQEVARLLVVPLVDFVGTEEEALDETNGFRVVVRVRQDRCGVRMGVVGDDEVVCSQLNDGVHRQVWDWETHHIFSQLIQSSASASVLV